MHGNGGGERIDSCMRREEEKAPWFLISRLDETRGPLLSRGIIKTGGEADRSAN
jgi:hypothetical protein